jgi:hypothetical protein
MGRLLYAAFGDSKVEIKKKRSTSASLHGALSEKAIISILAALKT